MMDREGLKNELMQYKRFSLQQYEQIRLLKVEIMKIKKIAAIKNAEAKGEIQKKENPGWVTNQDSNLVRPKDYQALKDELSELKQQLNDSEEEKRLHKANADKYERRARYTLEKFQEIKAKEMQLIQMGEDKMKGEVHLVETKFKKKIEKLSQKVKT